jgi:hypothetical protein
MRLLVGNFPMDSTIRRSHTFHLVSLHFTARRIEMIDFG